MISLEVSTKSSNLIASSILLHHFINFDVVNTDNEYSGITKIANRIPRSKVLCIYIQIPKLLYCSKKIRLTILKLGISKYKVGFVFGHNGRA